MFLAQVGCHSGWMDLETWIVYGKVAAKNTLL